MDLELAPTLTTKSPDDTEIDTPPYIHTQHINPLSFTTVATKNHHRHHLPSPPVVFTYKECMRNHAATLGGHAVDGCGEFMPSASADDQTSLKCAACGCHRNFHRRDPDFPVAAVITPPFLDFRHPPRRKRSSLSPSPPPHLHPSSMLLALNTAAEEHHQAPMTPTAENPAGRKRFRTKFSQEQKERMHSFSEKMGWKMQKCDEAAVGEFCREIGVAKGVLKVWMHNNKNTFGRKEITNGRSISFENHEEEKKIGNNSHFQNENGAGVSSL